MESIIIRYKIKES